MELVHVRYLKIFGLEKCLRYIRSVGPVHEDFVVLVRISIYLSSSHYITTLPPKCPSLYIFQGTIYHWVQFEKKIIALNIICYCFSHI